MPRRDHAFWQDALKGLFGTMPYDWMPQGEYALWLHAAEGNAFWQDAKIQGSQFFHEAPMFDLKILGLLNANILPISKNIGVAIALPVSPPLQLQWQLNLVNQKKSWLNPYLQSQFRITKSCSLFKSHVAF